MKLFWPGPIPFYGGACSCKQQTSEGHDQMGAEYMNIWSRSLWKSNLSSESGVDCTFRAFYTFELFFGMSLLAISCSRMKRGFEGLMLGEHCISELKIRIIMNQEQRLPCYAGKGHARWYTKEDMRGRRESGKGAGLPWQGPPLEPCKERKLGKHDDVAKDKQGEWVQENYWPSRPCIRQGKENLHLHPTYNPGGKYWSSW